VHDLDGRALHGHVRLGESSPATADGIKDRLGEGRRQLLTQERVDLLLGLVAILRHERLHG
jgi:hypothetical protein